MKLFEITDKIDKYVSNVMPADKARNLVVGDCESEVKKVLIVLALTEASIEKAIETKSELIICYTNMQVSAKDALIRKLVKKDIALYIIKNDLDTCSKGYEALIADSAKLLNKEIHTITFEEKCYKLVTCIPKMEEKHTEKVHQALGKMGVEDGTQGAGYIGTYSQVSDCMYGHQWFMTMPGSDPYVGEVGVLAKIDVERFEMIIPEHQVQACVDKLWELHPYEEVENDVYPLEEKRNQKGYGRFGSIKALSASAFEKNLKSELKLSKVTSYGSKKDIESVAVFAFACCDSLNAIIEKKVDVLVTCCIEQESILMLNANNINVIVLDHATVKTMALENLNCHVSEFAKSELFIEK